MISPTVKDRVRRLRQAGKSIRWIARHSGLSRQSVRKILNKTPAEKKGSDSPSDSAVNDGESTAESTESESEKRSSILDPFKDEIKRILENHERLKEKIPRTKELTTRIVLKAIRKSGYTGGRTILDDYLRSIRGSRRRARRPHCRFETPPAEESQQDWSPYSVLIAGVVTKIHVFSLILAWSRYQFLQAFANERFESLLYGHVAAFHYFQGIPWRIAYDRQAAITPCEIAGVPLIHRHFQEFADHYGYEIFLCAAGHKERKGKVEKPFLDFEQGFLPNRTFESFEDFNDQLARYRDGVDDPEDGNRRCHCTTGEVPYERWLEEREFLYELPPTDHVPRHVETRSLNHDCTVSVRGCLYSVPARLVEKGHREVWVSIGNDDLQIYDKKGELVATHRLADGPERLVIDESHYAGIRRRRNHARRLPELERRFLERFPTARDFLDGLKAAVRSLAPIHLREILALARRYSAEDLDAALRRALSDGTTTSGYVRQILQRRHPTGHLGQLRSETPRGLSLGAIESGDPSGYTNIFKDPERSTDHDDNDASNT